MKEIAPILNKEIEPILEFINKNRIHRINGKIL